MRKSIQIISTMALACLMCACSPQKSEKPVITVSIEPLRYLTEQIAGDKFDVVTMVPGGSSPETYEPSARQMMDLSHSELYIKVGNLGFERTWMKRLQNSQPHLLIIDSSQGITPVQSDEGMSDPHIWTSAPNMLRMAQNIYHSLAKVDSRDSLYFQERLNLLAEKILSTDTQIHQALDTLRQKKFLIFHPSLTYFAKEYNLEQIVIENEGREPSALQLQQTLARGRDARVLFKQREFSTHHTETAAKETGARIVEINPLAYDWQQEMLHITKALCDPSSK